MSYIIKDEKVIATTHETYKAGDVRIAWHRQGRGLVTAIDAKISNAKKWKARSCMDDSYNADSAILLSENGAYREFYAGTDKPVEIITTEADEAKSKAINIILNDKKDYSKLANTISKGFENKKSYTDLMIELQIMLRVSQSQSDDILRLWL